MSIDLERLNKKDVKYILKSILLSLKTEKEKWENIGYLSYLKGKIRIRLDNYTSSDYGSSVEKFNIQLIGEDVDEIIIRGLGFPFSLQRKIQRTLEKQERLKVRSLSAEAKREKINKMLAEIEGDYLSYNVQYLKKSVKTPVSELLSAE